MKKRMKKRGIIVKIFVLTVTLWLAYVPSVYSAGQTLGHLADVDFVAEKVGDSNWVILDGRSGGDYKAGHIPGAVSYGKKVVGVLKNPHDGQIKSSAELAELLGKIGLSNDKGLIVYGKKGDFHVLTEMSPVYVGVEKYYYLDGGYEAWVAAGKKVETKVNKPRPATFKVTKVNKDMYINTQELMEIVNSRDPKVTIIDVRSPQEYNADWVQSLRGGHIPGAIHIPHSMNINKKTGKFKSLKELTKIYKNVPKDHKVIFYCHRGCRTAYTYIALQNLGYDAVNYEEGWIVWGNRLDTPIENEHWRNMRGVDKKISVILKRLDALERQSTRSPAPGY